MFFRLLLVSLFLLSCDARHDEKVAERPIDKFEKTGVSFAALYQEVIVPKCLSCHRTATKKNHFVDLSSYERIVGNKTFPPLVVFGQPEESSLFTSVAEGRMPLRAAGLDASEILYLYMWISLGAKKERVKLGSDHGETDGGDSKEPGGNDEPGDNEPGDDEPGDDPQEPGGPGDDPNEPGEPGSDSDEP